jgi:hypothetical protein
LPNHPQEAIRAVADVATTGRYTTADGDVIDMTIMHNVLTPMFTKPNNFDPKNYGGNRDFFDQLFQTTAVETFWQTNGTVNTSTVQQLRAGETFKPGSHRYEFSTKSNSKEVINDYSTNPPSRLLAYEHSTMTSPLTDTRQTILESLPARSPQLGTDDLLQVGNKMLGIVQAPHLVARTGYGPGAENVNSSEELAGVLNSMKEKGQFPATVLVDSRDAVFNNSGKESASGGAHVINVQNIYKDADGKYLVEFTNQWGSTRDRLGRENAVPVEALYRALEFRPPEAAKARTVKAWLGQNKDRLTKQALGASALWGLNWATSAMSNTKDKTTDQHRDPLEEEKMVRFFQEMQERNDREQRPFVYPEINGKEPLAPASALSYVFGRKITTSIE